MNEGLKKEILYHTSKGVLNYIQTRFNRRLQPITREAIKQISEDELFMSWLSMNNAIQLIRYQLTLD